MYVLHTQLYQIITVRSDQSKMKHRVDKIIIRVNKERNMSKEICRPHFKRIRSTNLKIMAIPQEQCLGGLQTLRM